MSIKKILGINASPRIGGNCEILLNEAIKAAKDAGAMAEIVVLDTLTIAPWRETDPIRKSGESLVHDDMEKLENKIKDADAVVLASPIYFGSLSAQAKIMIDRCQILWERKNLLKQSFRQAPAKAVLICVQAANRDDFFQNAKQIARHFFNVIEVNYAGELFCAGLEGPGDVLKNPELLKKARSLGQKMAG